MSLYSAFSQFNPLFTPPPEGGNPDLDLRGFPVRPSKFLDSAL
jgi:hypothetical protein